jgi:hypothetical protein
MFPMEPPFPDMASGKIKVLHAGGDVIGKLIPYHFPQDHRFGARIDILGPLVHNSRAQPDPTGLFVTAGCSVVVVLKLSQALLRKIRRTGDPEIPYSLEMK